MYDWLENKKHSKYTYTGEYMSQYSWSEFYRADLDEVDFEDY